MIQQQHQNPAKHCDISGWNFPLPKICLFLKSLHWEDPRLPGEGSAILQLALAPGKSITAEAAAIQGHFVLC